MLLQMLKSKLLINIRNNTADPNTDPCGTPLRTDLQPDQGTLHINSLLTIL